MTLIIETGAGVRGANAYLNAAYVTAYLTERGRETENSWDSSTDAVKEASIIAATDYLEKRYFDRFKGQQKFTFKNVFAEGTVTFTGLPVDQETLVIGGEDWTYTFVDNLSGEPFEVLIGATASDTADNLAAALNAVAGEGTQWGQGTPQSRHTSAVAAGGAVTLTALAPGAGGNLTALTGSPTNVTLAVFSGGKDGGTQTLSWPREYAYDSRGNLISGVPDRLKQAISEYAVRAVSEALLPDPTVDPYAGQITARREEVGPIKEEVRYSFGTVGKFVFSPYPAADRLLRPLLLGSGGGVIRG